MHATYVGYHAYTFEISHPSGFMWCGCSLHHWNV